MNYKSKVLLIIIFVAFCFNGCGSIKGNKSDFNKISVKFSVGEGKQRVIFNLDLKNSEVLFESDKIVIKNSISDFTLPFNRSNTPLIRSAVAGDEVMNEVELIGRNNKTAIIFRLTTKGIGGGNGKIGVSLIAAFYLDKDILKGVEKNLFKIPSNGKLSSSEGKLKIINSLIQSDMDLVGVNSGTYTMIAGVRDSSSYFHGFVIFDPTNPESAGNAYFEFSSSESSNNWEIKEIEKKD